jgi:hypothetical protein
VAERVVVVITVDDSGHVTIDATGPLAGRQGLLAVLDSARQLAEQSGERGSPRG